VNEVKEAARSCARSRFRLQEHERLGLEPDNPIRLAEQQLYNERCEKLKTIVEGAPPGNLPSVHDCAELVARSQTAEAMTEHEAEETMAAVILLEMLT
jgi:hypothetical protein